MLAFFFFDRGRCLFWRSIQTTCRGAKKREPCVRRRGRRACAPRVVSRVAFLSAAAAVVGDPGKLDRLVRIRQRRLTGAVPDSRSRVSTCCATRRVGSFPRAVACFFGGPSGSAAAGESLRDRGRDPVCLRRSPVVGWIGGKDGGATCWEWPPGAAAPGINTSCR